MEVDIRSPQHVCCWYAKFGFVHCLKSETFFRTKSFTFSLIPVPFDDLEFEPSEQISARSIVYFPWASNRFRQVELLLEYTFCFILVFLHVGYEFLIVVFAMCETRFHSDRIIIVKSSGEVERRTHRKDKSEENKINLANSVETSVEIHKFRDFILATLWILIRCSTCPTTFNSNNGSDKLNLS